MSDGFTITLANEAELQRRLGQAIAGIERPRELLDRVGGVLEANINLRFDTKTAPDGTRWLPLAQSTRAAYAARYEAKVPGSLLERTRQLRGSLTHNAGDDYVDVGFTDRVAKWHETGTRTMPRRQLLTDDPIAGTLGAQDQRDVYEEIDAYLAELLGA